MSPAAGWLRSRLCAAAGLLLASTAAGAPDHPVPRALFSSHGIHEVSVSPSGAWLVAVGSRDDAWGVLVQRRGDGINVPVYGSKSPILDASWLGDDTLFVLHPPDEPVKGVVLRFEWNGHTVVHDQLDVRQPGVLVDPLSREDDALLWAKSDGERSFVERRSIDALGTRWKFAREMKAGEIERVAELRKPVTSWVTDPQGVVRAALAIEPSPSDVEITVHYREGPEDGWREVWRGDDVTEYLVPLAVTRDGGRLVVAARGGEDTRGLFAFDPHTGELADPIFRHPQVDVTGVRYDYSRTELIAAVYHEGGEDRFFYLDAFRDAHLDDLDDLGLGSGVMVTGSSRDYRFLTLLVRGPRNPGSFYLLDQDTDELFDLGDANFDVHPEWLLPTTVLRVESGDGTALEAFLTRPEATRDAPPPLVVLPHGGPIGVRDDRSFDPVVQFLALGGVAVLQVNYRGSGGYGRAFEEAGKGEWGRGIEDDVDAAVRAVVDRGLVDPDRMCIAGGSYGGYSALISAIRQPDRYRCVATINGVTDLPLMFASLSDPASATEVGRSIMSEIVGDPETDFDRMVEVSPVYRVEDLAAPVLIIHGTRDRRVDPEHAHRLRAMLRLHDHPYEWFEIRGAGHGFDGAQWERVAWLLRRFVTRHLAEGPAD